MDTNVYVCLTNGTASLIFLAFVGFLVFLCFQTRSKGLILVAGALINQVLNLKEASKTLMNVFFVRLATGIAYLEFVVLMGFLVFLCFQTRSRGLILISTVLIGVRFLRWIVYAVHNAYIGQWEPGLDVRSEELFRRLDFAIIISGIELVLFYSLCLLGVFLIYKEWRHGKFNYPPNRTRAG